MSICPSCKTSDNVSKYSHMKRLIDLIKDVGLGYLAKERYLKSKPGDYIDIKKAELMIRCRKGYPKKKLTLPPIKV